jgi:hypothetical protein
VAFGGADGIGVVVDAAQQRELVLGQRAVHVVRRDVVVRVGAASYQAPRSNSTVASSPRVTFRREHFNEP